MAKTFLLLLLSFSLPLRAQILSEAQCRHFDVRESRPELAEHFTTPRNQDSIGWCYGFSAADLLTFEMGRPVSAAHVSALYNRQVSGNLFWRTMYRFQRKDFDRVYSGGFPAMAINAAERNGQVCTEAGFPFDQNHHGETRQHIEAIERLRSEVRSADSEEAACEMIARVLPGPVFTDEQHREIRASLLRENLNRTLERIFTMQCTESVPVPSVDVRSERRPLIGGSRRHLERMNEVLNSGRPLAISYDVRHVTIASGKHSSVVVGREWRNGRCEFKVRNSWGHSCSGYKEGISCDREEGAFWVSDELLARMTYDFQYIRPSRSRSP
jgi:hypothetical protein